MNAELVLKLFSSTTQDSAMAQADLDYASWDFVMSDDWDTATNPQIRVSSGITVDEDGLIHIPLTDTNTEELIAALGTAESVTLGCELCGFATGETPPSFVLQWDISVRNRRSDAGTGTPTAVPDGSYNAAQIDALLADKANVIDIIVYSAGTGIDIAEGTIGIDVTGATVGQVLKKTANGVGWADESGGDVLPEVTSTDNDKVLTVVSGAWNKADAPISATATNVKSALGISGTGSASKFLNEQGAFVVVESGTSYTAGAGITITNDAISIDITGATTGQVFKKSADGLVWADETIELPTVSGTDNGKILSVVSGVWDKSDAPISATTVNVQNALSIDTSTGSTSKVLSQKGTFVDLPSGGGGTSDVSALQAFYYSMIGL
jgi:hypothetical protein